MQSTHHQQRFARGFSVCQRLSRRAPCGSGVAQVKQPQATVHRRRRGDHGTHARLFEAVPLSSRPLYFCFTTLPSRFRRGAVIRVLLLVCTRYGNLSGVLFWRHSPNTRCPLAFTLWTANLSRCANPCGMAGSDCFEKTGHLSVRTASEGTLGSKSMS